MTESMEQDLATALRQHVDRSPGGKAYAGPLAAAEATREAIVTLGRFEHEQQRRIDAARPGDHRIVVDGKVVYSGNRMECFLRGQQYNNCTIEPKTQGEPADKPFKIWLITDMHPGSEPDEHAFATEAQRDAFIDGVFVALNADYALVSGPDWVLDEHLMPVRKPSPAKSVQEVAAATGIDANEVPELGAVLQRGLFVGRRDPLRNSDFAGRWMVCEDLHAGPTKDGGVGGYCIVGDDLSAMIREAYDHFDLGADAELEGGMRP